jgi:Concanavalin A-like lectin/glucanases superfamily
MRGAGATAMNRLDDVQNRARWHPLALGSVALAALVIGPAGGAEDASFGFDGSASPGQVYVKPGGDAPTFVAGHAGEAIAFATGAVVALPFDIDPANHPRITFSAWLKADADAAGQPWILSPGAGTSLPAVRMKGRRVAIEGRRADGSGQLHSDALLPVGEWVHVVVTWDYAARTAAIQVGDEVTRFDDLRMDVAANQVAKQPLYVAPDATADAEPEPWIFLGARNFKTYNFPANGFAIDEVRIATSGGAAASAAGVVSGVSGGALPNRTADAIPVEDIAAARDATTISKSTETAGGGQASMPGGPTLSEDTLSAIEANRIDTPTPGYESEEAAQAAAEERARAAASQQTSSGTTATQQAFEPAGKPHPVGDPSFTSVAGHTGTNKRVLDLASSFASSFSWAEVSDNPCYFQVEGPDYTGHKGIDVGCPPTWGGYIKGPELEEGQHFVSLDNGMVIGRLEVCTTYMANKRLKGLRIWGGKINPDGTDTYVPSSDEEALPNCSQWSASVLCPIGQYATGVIVHSNDAQAADNEEIVGLQLICRRIGVD